MKYLLLLCFLTLGLCYAISSADIRFLLDREQFPLLARHSADIEALVEGSSEDTSLVLEYAQRTENINLAMRCHTRLALQHHSIDDALEWLRLADAIGQDSLTFKAEIKRLQDEFSGAGEKINLDYFLESTPEEEYLEQISHLRGYNPLIEELAKSWIDEISVEASDSLAISKIDRFEQYFPLSKWAQVAFYYRLYHLAQKSDFTQMNELIQAQGSRSSEYLYISALYLLSPTYRRQQTDRSNIEILEQVVGMLDSALNDYSQEEKIQVLYDLYTPKEWQDKLTLTRIKARYYQLLAPLGLFGDEEDLTALLKKPNTQLITLSKDIEDLSFANNDRGEIAEIYYWKGRIQALQAKRKSLLSAAKSFSTCLIYGAPRKKYDVSALAGIESIRKHLGIRTDTQAWIRKLMKYSGIVLEEMPFAQKNYTRIAIGDYDNDGYSDLLLNGNALYRNKAGQGFEDVSDTTNVARNSTSGALWADFNQDGLLDFATISHAEEGLGEALMKNMDGTRFAKVNERAGDIDDHFPTEGAAWVDVDGQGYPSLYSANYEKWQQRNGYPDYFWHNDKGYFEDQSVSKGFRLAEYTDNPGLAGRGVAPADFDNDGKQEILVTNYRLMRNLCWKQADTLFVDVAALYGLAGKYKDGYYGHSIGADWGDYDNDGDLDLFIANLAHPRYIDISDISQLLRNDGLAYQVVEGDTIYYWKFTDVTKAAGITFDELHSDPLWVDLDNDGYLDLFITSVYENDRSYLYKNNGNGTFTDITYLAGARVYNGWGNATADLDRDGLTDLVVGSGNGSKILLNRTRTKNKALYIKPVWKSGEVLWEKDWREFGTAPNSPAFGTRVRLTIKNKGKTYSLVRELCSAKGTTSQSAQELQFGLGKGKVVKIERVNYEKD